MCTATWLALDNPSSYALYFNRDESRLRGRATAPEVLCRSPHQPAILAPRDADAGGTWIAVNTFGVTVCLLNRYRDAERVAVPRDRRRSRGLLVLDLAVSADLAEVRQALEHQELDRYPAFTVLAAAPGDPPSAAAFHWTGHRLEGPETPTWPISSSGFDAAAASQARSTLWHEISGGSDGTPEQALELHRSHRPRRGALSPCMHRGVASTVSLTVVRVETSQISMRYAGGPPCMVPLCEAVRLER